MALVSGIITINSKNEFSTFKRMQVSDITDLLKLPKQLQYEIGIDQSTSCTGIYIQDTKNLVNILLELEYANKDKKDYSVFYLTTTTNYYASKNNFSTETALLIDTDTKYTDVLYNGEAITQKVVYKLEVDKPISAKIKTDVRFGGNAYIGLSGQGISQKILEDYQILQKGTYYLTFSKRSVSDGGIVAFKVLKK